MNKESVLKFCKRRIPDLLFVVFLFACFYFIAEDPAPTSIDEVTSTNDQVPEKKDVLDLPQKELEVPESVPVPEAKPPQHPFESIKKVDKPTTQDAPSLESSFKNLNTPQVSEDALKARNDYFNKLSLQLKELQSGTKDDELQKIEDEKLEEDEALDFPLEIPEDLQGYDDQEE